MTGTTKQIIEFLLDEDKATLWDLKPHKATRSLKANAYFHRLVGLLAKGEKEKFYKKKNELITQYGNQKFLKDAKGEYIIEYLPDTDAYKWHEYKHYFPTPYGGEVTGKNGKGVTLRAFLLLMGTHQYKADEMAHLIDCTRNECLGCGIPMEEVETYDEKRLMDELRKKANGKKHN